MRITRFFIRLRHWEYWPFHYVYSVIYPYWFWLSLRAGSFFFFNAANPGIRYGGFLMESKREIYDLLPGGTYPATMLITVGETFEFVQTQLISQQLQFPLIAKPDIGMRGMGVALLHSLDDLQRYHAASKVDYLLQQYVDYPNEAGIFYCRMPGEAKGKITGIVGKDFLKVTGDGSKTIRQLLQQEKRFALQLPVLEIACGKELDVVLLQGEEKLLVPFGNHSRGAKFLDYTHLNNPQITETINAICSRIPGFYFGRLDIKYNHWDELCRGQHFSIIELNGAGSEPAHIYDPKHSIFFGWKEIIRHLNLLYKVSVRNKKAGAKFLTVKEGLQMFRDNKEQIKLISA